MANGKIGVALIGDENDAEHRYLLQRLYSDLKTDAAHLVEVFLPVHVEAEKAGYTLSAMEAHYEQNIIFENADIVVALLSKTCDTWLRIGEAYGLRKQVFAFSPRGEAIPPALACGYIMLNVTPDFEVDTKMAFKAVQDDRSIINLEYTHAVDAAMARLIEAFELLFPVYRAPMPAYETAYAIGMALRTKWEKKETNAD